MLRARESKVEVEGKTFTIRRPTDADAASMGGAAPLEAIRRHVVGWTLQEHEVIPGGGADPVPFDAAVFGEWVADQPALWEPLGMAILDAYKQHVDRRSEAAKN